MWDREGGGRESQKASYHPSFHRNAYNCAIIARHSCSSPSWRARVIVVDAAVIISSRIVSWRVYTLVMLQPSTFVQWWTIAAAVAAVSCSTNSNRNSSAFSAPATVSGIRVYTAPLDDTGRTTVYWTVNYASRTVKFEVHFSATSGPFDWLALGFSGRGNHTEADFCFMWVDWKGVTGMLVSSFGYIYIRSRFTFM